MGFLGDVLQVLIALLVWMLAFVAIVFVAAYQFQAKDGSDFVRAFILPPAISLILLYAIRLFLAKARSNNEQLFLSFAALFLSALSCGSVAIGGAVLWMDIGNPYGIALFLVSLALASIIFWSVITYKSEQNAIFTEQLYWNLRVFLGKKGSFHN